MSPPSAPFDAAILRHLAEDMAWAGDGAGLSAIQVDQLAATWRPFASPSPREEESFDLVDARGRATGVTAPRWLCHLLGLCHRTVHLVLRTPQRLLVLQQRSRRVLNWPGRLDLAVTGHVPAGLTWQEALRQEAAEELGLEIAGPAGALSAAGVILVARYCRRQTDGENPPEHVCHATQLYAATLTPAGLAGLAFADGEVDALYLCGEAEAGRLLVEEPGRVAPGLVQSLPRYLAWLRTREERPG